MADRFAVIDMQQALKAKGFPTVTLWNRVEGRPRTVNFERVARRGLRGRLSGRGTAMRYGCFLVSGR